MTMKEAVAAGVSKLRRDPWEPWSHIEIYLFRGGHGPWVKVRTGHGIPDMEGVVDGAFEETMFSPEFDWDEDAWEEWEAPT